MKPYFIGFAMLALVACSPAVSTNITKTYPALDYKEEVTVVGILQEVPAAAVLVGSVKIGDSGFSTDCGWDVVLNQAKTEARKAGGNVLKITSHTPPAAFGSSCDQITAKIYRIENADDVAKMKESMKPAIDSTWNYAKIYLYRPGGVGALVGYDVHLGDSIIWRAKNNSKAELRITKKGMNSIWAKTESKSEVPIDIEYGREYYLRCTIVMGAMVGRPMLQLIDNTEGKTEYQTVKN
jgi:hypothetical protein